MKISLLNHAFGIALAAVILVACAQNANGPTNESGDQSADALVSVTDGGAETDAEQSDNENAGAQRDANPIGADEGVDSPLPVDGGSVNMDAEIAEPTDAAVGEPIFVDAAAEDAAMVDMAVPDASIVDAATPDAGIPDAFVVDVAVPDASVVDAAVPDASVVDATVPDATVPDASVVDATVQDPSQPSIPTACSPLNQGDCACNDDEGFTTWTWWVEGQQRCATAYVPSGIQGAAPVLISNDCYTSNSLGECQRGSEMVAAADRFGFVGICTTSADGNWTFGNDGEINDANPTPCAEEDSKDISYIDGVFAIIDRLGAAGQASVENVYAWGFSQNAMFTAYMSFCYPARIKGFWQGGSGLFVKGETNPLPQMEGVCRRSDYLQFGRDCVQRAPCESCQYFPIYPASATPPLSACIMAYADDYLAETAAPMARLMTQEGHQATRLEFPAIGRGHSNSLMHWDWMVGCMGIVSSCSAACSRAVVECVENQAGNSAQVREGHYDGCINAGLEGCQAGCAPTLAMLRVVERPCLVDGLCDQGETQVTCPVDCGEAPGGSDGNGNDHQLPSCAELNQFGACCGDNVCDGPENAQNCTADCTGEGIGGTPQLASCDELNQANACCGDNVCDGPENAENCLVDCTANDDGGIEQLASCALLGRSNACCGDNVCDGPENALNCIEDCR